MNSRPKTLLQAYWHRPLTQEHTTYFKYWLFLNTLLLSILLNQYLMIQFPVHLTEGSNAGRILLYIYNTLFYLVYVGLGNAIVSTALVVPILLTLRNKTLCSIWTIFIGFTISAFFLADSLVFSTFRFHLNTSLINIISSPGVFSVLTLSLYEWVIIGCVLFSLLIMQAIIVYLSWKHRPKFLANMGRKIAFSYFTAFVLLYAAYFSGLNISSGALNQITKALPYHNQILNVLLFGTNKKGMIDNLKFSKFYQLNQTTAPMSYPLKPLVCKPIKKYNILVVVIDTWRYDALTTKIMPKLSQNLSKFSQFQHHMSGGNSTLSGLFSMFYSLPNSYWTSALEQEKGPILISQLKKQNYDIGIFSSATIKIPEYNRTLFVDVDKPMKDTPGLFPVQRDKRITQDFKHFINNRDPQRPFFAYLIYNMAHAYCTKQDFSTPFQPQASYCLRMNMRLSSQSRSYRNRYDNAVHFVDTQINQIMAKLSKSKLLNDTIIIITSDHGQQFNDNGLGYWEHASNYTNYQLHVPLLIHWPSHKVKHYSHKTTHYDIIPTLMRRALGCNNPTTDYSIGHDIYEPYAMDYLLAGSYVNFGIITNDTITVLNPSGDFIVQNKEGKAITQSPNLEHIQDVLRVMRKFYRPTEKID